MSVPIERLRAALAKVQAQKEAATPGPWFGHPAPPMGVTLELRGPWFSGSDYPQVPIAEFGAGSRSPEADAALIVSAVNLYCTTVEAILTDAIEDMSEAGNYWNGRRTVALRLADDILEEGAR